MQIYAAFKFQHLIFKRKQNEGYQLFSSACCKKQIPRTSVQRSDILEHRKTYRQTDKLRHNHRTTYPWNVLEEIYEIK